MNIGRQNEFVRFDPEALPVDNPPAGIVTQLRVIFTTDFRSELRAMHVFGVFSTDQNFESSMFK